MSCTDETPLDGSRKWIRWIENYGFHKLIGLKVDRLEPGLCQTSLDVGTQHLNPFNMVHGSVVFALADVAFGVACNNNGQSAVTIASSIQFFASAELGDHITALAREISLGGKTAHYQVEVKRRDGTPMAFATGVMYRRSTPVEEWMPTKEKILAKS